MKKAFVAAIVLLPVVTAAQGAWAFDCGNRFAAAGAAIAQATTAMNGMNGMNDPVAKELVHTFIDDAKMLLGSGRHNHQKPAAGKYDHARAIAKANAAEGYAQAASVLARR